MEMLLQQSFLTCIGGKSVYLPSRKGLSVSKVL